VAVKGFIFKKNGSFLTRYHSNPLVM